MSQAVAKIYTDKIEVSRGEYQRLKQLERKFSYFLRFAEHAKDIRESRNDLKRGMGVSQKELFKELGL